ncbi:c-type cytochrome [Hymenobacter sp. H14-R3]|uniref:c-type cytochrome n=1 Tax=Hymenobacter sp. H14-R3 TaxID=3046308 RepID=UPI0024B88F2E|nr:c-type cytochrome [Hymenobacter sp. H14-R3]MDJ0364199.1 c-type cytochrome [Hymenobacter sp. H14-R3]
MKKIALLLSLGALVAACDSGYKPDGADTQATVTTPVDATAHDTTAGAKVAAVANQVQVDTNVTKIGTEHSGGVMNKGAQLIAGSDCGGCHKQNEKVVGPSYVEIAQKYPATAANIAMLGNKIITGGKGNWGEIPMTPHPTLALADAKEMTKYILSLK